MSSPFESAAEALVSQLRAVGVDLFIEGDSIRYSAPRGAMTDGLRASLVKHKVAVIEVLSRESVRDRIVRLQRKPGETLPMSFEQQRLWFLDQLAPGNAFYNVPAVVPIDAFIDPRVLRRCIEEIICRHESLRTVFPTIAGVPVQSVLPIEAFKFDMPTVDLTELPAADRDAEATRFETEARIQPFELAVGPLVRALLIKLSETKWRLLLTMHHIVSDGWSMKLLARELTSLYSAYIAGRPSPLPELPIQYADFATWQRKRLSSGSGRERHISYWRQQLQGMEPLSLPTDRPRPAFQTFRGGAEPVSISRSLSDQVRKLGALEGATSFMVLAAGWAAVLSRYARQNDIPIGTYVANRTQPELESLIGFFVNTIVLRIDTSADPTFQVLLRRVRDTAIAAYSHQEFPFSELVQELHPSRDLSRNPLFQVVLTLSSSEKRPAPQSSAMSERPAIFDLVLDLVETPDGIEGCLAYSTDLFDSQTAKRLSNHFVTFIEAAAQSPHHQISAMPLLSVVERRRLLLDWNETARSYPDWPGVAAMFREQVSRTPDAVSLILSSGESLSYAALADRVDSTVGMLLAAGVGESTRVGVCLHRSFESVAAVIAIHHLRACYVPLDPTYPHNRLDFMLRDSGARVVITSADVLANLPEDVAEIRIGTSRTAKNAALPTKVCANAAPEDLAYIIYTSGSTGTPKGVAVEHKQILNRLHWMWQAYPFGGEEMCCLKTPLSFVDSIWEIYGPLLRGVPSVIISDNEVRDVESLVEILKRHHVTRIWVVPDLLRAIMELAPEPNALHDLTFWVVSGDKLTTDLLSTFKTCIPSGCLYNIYGTSEVWDATCFEAGRDCEATDLGHSVPIGRPIANMRAYVLDDTKQLTPIGVYGELYIAGDGLAREYLNSAGLTSERFLPDPFWAEVQSGHDASHRMYRTGDIVRWRNDGNLEFFGRTDRQVKVRGFRVEPEEIEVAIRSHDRIREAAVALWRDETEVGARSDGVVVAYIVAPQQCLTPDDLSSWLRNRLPDYMIPAVYITMNELPKTPSGKVDKRSLPRPTCELRLARTVCPPETEIERALAEVWAEVLAIEQPALPSVTDDFFKDAGGHSLLATQLISRVRARFGIPLALRAIFENPTIRGLARLVESVNREGTERSKTDSNSLVRGLGPIPRLARNRYIVTEDEIRSPSGSTP